MSTPEFRDWKYKLLDENEVWQYYNNPAKKVRLVERGGNYKKNGVVVDHGNYVHTYNHNDFLEQYKPVEIKP